MVLNDFCYGLVAWSLVIWCCWHIERTCSAAQAVGTPVGKRKKRPVKQQPVIPESVIGRLMGIPAAALQRSPGLMENLVGHAVTDKRAPVNMLSLSDFVFACCFQLVNALQDETSNISKRKVLSLLLPYHGAVVLFCVFRNGLWASLKMDWETYKFSLYNIAAIGSCVSFCLLTVLLELSRNVDESSPSISNQSAQNLEIVHYTLLQFVLASLCNPLWMLCYEFSGSYLFIFWTAWTSAEYLLFGPGYILELIESTIDAAAMLESSDSTMHWYHSRSLVYVSYINPFINFVMGALFILQRFELLGKHTRRLYKAVVSDIKLAKTESGRKKSD